MCDELVTRNREFGTAAVFSTRGHAAQEDRKGDSARGGFANLRRWPCRL